MPRQVYLIESETEKFVVEDWELVKKTKKKFRSRVTPLPFFPSHKENEALINEVIHLKNRIRSYKGTITKLKKYKEIVDMNSVP